MPSTTKDNDFCFKIETNEMAYSVEFSPFVWSASLLAIGFAKSVKVIQCRFKEESPEADDFAYETLLLFAQDSRAHAIAWSPETQLSVPSKLIRLATAGGDRKIRILTSDMDTENSIVVLEGHSGYVNAVAFEPEHGSQVASTGDDLTCRIWNLDGTTKACLRLKSPGMAVCWHSQDPGKIMVAQMNGIIRFYNVERQVPLMSLESGLSPLLSADWCPSNHLRVGAVADANWFVWDISRSSLPQDSGHVHTDGALTFRWAHSNSNLFGTSGRPRHEIKITNYAQKQVHFASSFPVGSGITWHNKLAAIATIDNRFINLWKLDII